jgi:hypothetical protein
MAPRHSPRIGLFSFLITSVVVGYVIAHYSTLPRFRFTFQCPTGTYVAFEDASGRCHLLACGTLIVDSELFLKSPSGLRLTPAITVAEDTTVLCIDDAGYVHASSNAPESNTVIGSISIWETNNHNSVQPRLPAHSIEAVQCKPRSNAISVTSHNPHSLHLIRLLPILLLGAYCAFWRH